VPDRFSEATTRPTTQPVNLTEWWTTFHDPELDSLIRRAAESNLDLRIAVSRIREARAARGVSASRLYPDINASGQYQRLRTSANLLPSAAIAQTFGGAGSAAGAAPPPLAFGGVEQDIWQDGFDASWELDIFGGVRRSVEAAMADIGAAEENRRDVLVSLLAEVARNYVELRGLQSQLAIARENLRSQQQTLELTQSRFRAGLTGQLDVTRAQTQVSTTESVIPTFQTGIRQSLHRLAILLAKPPDALADELTSPAPIPTGPSAIPVGLPSELLLRRPDIRRAERQLAAATARIGVATADLYPRFSLNGQFGFQSTQFKSFFDYDSRMWAFGPAITFPIFNAGRIRFNIRIQNERQQQSLFQYEQTILVALADVENALVDFRNQQDRRRSLADAVASARQSVELSTELYQKGLTDFLTVLEAQRSLFTTQDALARSERDVAAALVALYKALGGGW